MTSDDPSTFAGCDPLDPQRTPGVRTSSPDNPMDPADLQQAKSGWTDFVPRSTGLVDSEIDRVTMDPADFHDQTMNPACVKDTIDYPPQATRPPERPWVPDPASHPRHARSPAVARRRSMKHTVEYPQFPKPPKIGYPDCLNDPAAVWRAKTVLGWREGDVDPASTPPWTDDENRPAHDFKADEPHDPTCVIGTPVGDMVARGNVRSSYHDAIYSPRKVTK